MKNVILLLATVFATSAFAHGPLKIDLEKSKIYWTGAKVTGEHTGTLNLKAAALTMEDGKLTGGSFTADMGSITVTDLSGNYAKKLEGHLMSDDFFSTDKHPTADFVITEVSGGDNGAYNVTGDLTIKGITHPVSFVANITAEAATATIKVDRTKYDVKYGSGSFFQGLGDKMIYDEFELKVELAL